MGVTWRTWKGMVVALLPITAMIILAPWYVTTTWAMFMLVTAELKE